MAKYLIIHSAYETHSVGIFEADTETEAKIKFVKYHIDIDKKNNDNLGSDLYGFCYEFCYDDEMSIDEYINKYLFEGESECYTHAVVLNKKEGVFKEYYDPKKNKYIREFV